MQMRGATLLRRGRSVLAESPEVLEVLRAAGCALHRAQVLAS